jgi:hypothetical protein
MEEAQEWRAQFPAHPPNLPIRQNPPSLENSPTLTQIPISSKISQSLGNFSLIPDEFPLSLMNFPSREARCRRRRDGERSSRRTRPTPHLSKTPLIPSKIPIPSKIHQSLVKFLNPSYISPIFSSSFLLSLQVLEHKFPIPSKFFPDPQ